MLGESIEESAYYLWNYLCLHCGNTRNRLFLLGLFSLPYKIRKSEWHYFSDGIEILFEPDIDYMTAISIGEISDFKLNREINSLDLRYGVIADHVLGFGRDRTVKVFKVDGNPIVEYKVTFFK